MENIIKCEQEMLQVYVKLRNQFKVIVLKLDGTVTNIQINFEICYYGTYSHQ